MLALCLVSLLLSLFAYAGTKPVLAVLLLNLAILALVGLQQWGSRKSIKFQPQELAERCCKYRKTNATASAVSCMTISANC
jgi:hypothetical protein